MLAEQFSSPPCTGIKGWERSPAREMSKRGATQHAASPANSHICFLLRPNNPRAERGAGREGQTSESLSWPSVLVSRGNADPLEGPVAGRGDPFCKPPMCGLAAGAGGCWHDACEWAACHPATRLQICSRQSTDTRRGASGGHGLGETVPPARGPWAARGDNSSRAVMLLGQEYCLGQGVEMWEIILWEQVYLLEAAPRRRQGGRC